MASSSEDISYKFLIDSFLKGTSQNITCDDISKFSAKVSSDSFNRKLNCEMKWDNCEQFSALCKIVTHISSYGYVNEIDNKDDYPYSANDFEKNIHTATEVLKCIAQLMEHIKKLQSDSEYIHEDGMKKLNLMAPSCLYLIGEHDDTNVWNTEETRNQAKIVTSSLLNLYGDKYNSMDELLNIPECGIIISLMNILKVKLQKSSWKRNPSAPFVFRKYLLCVSIESYLTLYLQAKIVKVVEFYIIDLRSKSIFFIGIFREVGHFDVSQPNWNSITV